MDVDKEISELKDRMDEAFKRIRNVEVDKWAEGCESKLTLLEQKIEVMNGYVIHLMGTLSTLREEISERANTNYVKRQFGAINDWIGNKGEQRISLLEHKVRVMTDNIKFLAGVLDELHDDVDSISSGRLKIG